MSTESKNKVEKVEIGPIQYDPNDRANKFLYISVNGKIIMLERGKREKVPPEFAEAYEHRIAMAGRRIAERDRMDRELREKQNAEGVSFM